MLFAALALLVLAGSLAVIVVSIGLFSNPIFIDFE
jgi:hypothetical protein